MNPEDISFLRSKLIEESSRSPKSLKTLSEFDKIFKDPSSDVPSKRPRQILPKEEIERLKSRAKLTASSPQSLPSGSTSKKLGKLELLLKGLLWYYQWIEFSANLSCK